MSKTDTEVGVSEQQIREIKEDAKNRIKAVKASAKEEIHRIQMECYTALKPAERMISTSVSKRYSPFSSSSRTQARSQSTQSGTCENSVSPPFARI